MQAHEQQPGKTVCISRASIRSTIVFQAPCLDNAPILCVMNCMCCRHPYGSVLHDFLAGILAERGAPPVSGQKGPQLVLSRLVDLLKDSSLEPAPSSALPEVGVQLYSIYTGMHSLLA
jgi:hypothetical protein